MSNVNFYLFLLQFLTLFLRLFENHWFPNIFTSSHTVFFRFYVLLFSYRITYSFPVNSILLSTYYQLGTTYKIYICIHVINYNNMLLFEHFDRLIVEFSKWMMGGGSTSDCGKRIVSRDHTCKNILELFQTFLKDVSEEFCDYGGDLVQGFSVTGGTWNVVMHFQNRRHGFSIQLLTLSQRSYLFHFGNSFFSFPCCLLFSVLFSFTYLFLLFFCSTLFFFSCLFLHNFTS